jgi:hypothetical protein
LHRSSGATREPRTTYAHAREGGIQSDCSSSQRNDRIPEERSADISKRLSLSCQKVLIEARGSARHVWLRCRRPFPAHVRELRRASPMWKWAEGNCGSREGVARGQCRKHDRATAVTGAPGDSCLNHGIIRGAPETRYSASDTPIPCPRRSFARGKGFASLYGKLLPEMTLCPSAMNI